jgi:hypothetical protein
VTNIGISLDVAEYSEKGPLFARLSRPALANNTSSRSQKAQPWSAFMPLRRISQERHVGNEQLFYTGDTYYGI